MRTRVREMFGIEFPIFAFTHCRDVVVAVSRAGGFGVLGAAGFSPRQLKIELEWIDEHVGDKPYGVDVLIPVSYVGREKEGNVSRADLDKLIPEGHRHYVEELLERYHVPPLPDDSGRPRRTPPWSQHGARAQVEIALSHPVKLLVSALGPPPQDVIDQAHAKGVKVAALVGKASQAIKQVAAGVDIIVATGTEAGGHTGEISTLVLVPDVVDAVRPTPVLAAGGIGCGRQVAAALALGAEGVWTGSLWLTVREAETIPPVVEKLLRATSSDTVRSRCMTGKPVRQLRTPWTDAWEGPESPGVLPMPLQTLLTAEAQARIQRHAHVEGSGAKDLITTPVGQIVGRMNSVQSSHEVIYDIVNEFIDAASRLAALLATAEEEPTAAPAEKPPPG